MSVGLQVRNILIHIVEWAGVILFPSRQTNDIIEYLKRLSKTTVPEGIMQFIKARHHCLVLWCDQGKVVLWCDQGRVVKASHCHIHVTLCFPHAAVYPQLWEGEAGAKEEQILCGEQLPGEGGVAGVWPGREDVGTKVLGEEGMESAVMCSSSHVQSLRSYPHIINANQ